MAQGPLRSNEQARWIMTSILDWQNRLRVRLTVDLTGYHPSLANGAEGVVVSFIGSNDCFWKVRFPGAGAWDILPDGLEILDKEFLEWREDEKRKRYEKILREAREGIWYLGPRGGYRGFSIECKHGNEVAHGREEAEKIAKMLEDHGIPVRKEVMK